MMPDETLVPLEFQTECELMLRLPVYPPPGIKVAGMPDGRIIFASIGDLDRYVLRAGVLDEKAGKVVWPKHDS